MYTEPLLSVQVYKMATNDIINLNGPVYPDNYAEKYIEPSLLAFQKKFWDDKPYQTQVLNLFKIVVKDSKGKDVSIPRPGIWTQIAGHLQGAFSLMIGSENNTDQLCIDVSKYKELKTATLVCFILLLQVYLMDYTVNTVPNNNVHLATLISKLDFRSSR
jgi:hypothetical protein